MNFDIKRENVASETTNASKYNNDPSSLLTDKGLNLSNSHYIGCFRNLKFRHFKCQKIILAPLTYEFWISICILIDVYMIIMIFRLLGIFV